MLAALRSIDAEKYRLTWTNGSTERTGGTRVADLSFRDSVDTKVDRCTLHGDHDRPRLQRRDSL